MKKMRWVERACMGETRNEIHVSEFILAQAVKIWSDFVEPESSLPSSQESATGLCPDQHVSTPRLPIYSHKILVNKSRGEMTTWET
jgi:hypothetical protein